MKAFQAALTAFWKGFTYAGEPVKAFLSGHVPSGTQFPYITFDVSKGDAFSGNVLTAFVWCKGNTANVQRAEILDLIADAIPHGGRKLAFGSGYAVLYRNAAGFQSLYDDPEDASVLGGRISYEINYYSI